MSILPEERMRAYVSGPLRSGNGDQYGFYDIGGLRQALIYSGKSYYRVGSVHRKNISNLQDLEQVKKLIQDPRLEYAMVDKEKVVFVQVADKSNKEPVEWLGNFKALGYQVKAGGKTAKRLKALHRPTLLNAHFQVDDFKISHVACDTYSREKDEIKRKYNPSVTYAERLLDGAMVISRRVVEVAIRNIPSFKPEVGEDPNEYFYNPFVRNDLVQAARRAKVFNVRIITPDGIYKGNAFVVDDPIDREGNRVDLITDSINLKSELSYSKGVRFLAEEQSAKTRVHTDDQTLSNFPMLFKYDEMDQWLYEEYEKIYNDSINDKDLINWRNIWQRSWRDRVDPEDEESQARMSFIGWRWRAMGMRVTDSPWLFEALAIGSARPLADKIPIPCALYEQIISESMANMAGIKIMVEPGEIRRCDELEVHVVNDIDWIDMYESHGGCDQDDFFKLFYRTMDGGNLDGQKVVIAVRSPNGFGEYSIFKYHEGDTYPEWKLSDGTTKSFLSVQGRGWPTRLKDVLDSGEVRYSRLPSQLKPKDKSLRDDYTRQDVVNDLEAWWGSGTVGKFVNASMLYASVFQKHRAVQICSLEDAIDGYTQTTDVNDRKRIDEDAELMVREVIASGLKVDRVLWDAWNRRFDRYLSQGEWIEKFDGPLTNLNTLCNKYFEIHKKRVRDYAQRHIKPNPLVVTLGTRMSFFGLNDLNNWRKAVTEANSHAIQQGGKIDRVIWDRLYNLLVERIKYYGVWGGTDPVYTGTKEKDQHDAVLGFYLASLNNQTVSSNRVSDQIVMNRKVFPYLQAALEFYGIALRVFPQMENGVLKFNQTRTVEWAYIDPETKVSTVFTDPIEYHRFMNQKSNIVHSSVRQQSAS